MERGYAPPGTLAWNAAGTGIWSGFFANERNHNSWGNDDQLPGNASYRLIEFNILLEKKTGSNDITCTYSHPIPNGIQRRRYK
jgi:hypothetical protein